MMSSMVTWLLVVYVCCIRQAECVNWPTQANGLKIKDFSMKGDVEEILHGEHASDLLDSHVETVYRNAYFFLYRKECVGDIDQLLTEDIRNYTPDLQYLTLMRHDYEAYYDMIWFNQTGRKINIKKAYNLADDICSCLVHINRGNRSIFEFPCQKLPASKEEFIDTVWKDMAFDMTVYNNLDRHIKITVQGKGPKLADLQLSPKSSSILLVYPSYDILAYTAPDTLGSTTFLDGWHVNSSRLTCINVNEPYQQVTEVEWKARAEDEIRKEADHLSKQASHHAHRHFAILVQRYQVHQFNEHGFLRMKIPKPLFKDLLAVYNNHQHLITDEVLPSHFTLWNHNEVDINRILLDKTYSKNLHDYMRPVAERFCNCKLNQLDNRGITTRLRTYTTGSKIRMHVDELSTGHVIGSILHIKREPENEHNWPLEMIGNNGQRNIILMQPGEMVFFESSRIPHGRTTYYKGRKFVNTFFYYYPADGWKPTEEEQNKDFLVKTEL